MRCHSFWSPAVTEPTKAIRAIEYAVFPSGHQRIVCVLVSAGVKVQGVFGTDRLSTEAVILVGDDVLELLLNPAGLLLLLLRLGNLFQHFFRVVVFRVERQRLFIIPPGLLHFPVFHVSLREAVPHVS